MSENHFNNAPSQQGIVEVICGSMFSGKTEELIRRVNRVLLAKKTVKIFKPAMDTRYSASAVVSHNKNSVEAIAVQNAAHILDHTKNCDVIAIDEAQFFTEALIPLCRALAKQNKRVIVAGLDMDYKGEPFGAMPQLLAIADDVTKLHAICVECGQPASFTYRFSEQVQLIELGESDKYSALCRNCYNNKV